MKAFRITLLDEDGTTIANILMKAKSIESARTIILKNYCYNPYSTIGNIIEIDMEDIKI